MKDDLIQSLFQRELERLEIKSKEAPLDMEDLKRLEILTRSLKQHSKQEQPPQEDELANLTTEELIKFIRQDSHDERQDKTKSSPSTTRTQRDGKEGSK